MAAAPVLESAETAQSAAVTASAGAQHVSQTVAAAQAPVSEQTATSPSQAQPTAEAVAAVATGAGQLTHRIVNFYHLADIERPFEVCMTVCALAPSLSVCSDTGALCW